MANEYLKRTYTSTGNLKVGTFSFWIKGRPYDTNQTRPVYLYDGSNLFQILVERTSGTNPGQIIIYGASANIRYKGVYRDPSAWSHYLIKVDNTTNGAEARFEVYVNGVKLEIVGSQTTSTASYPARDANVFNNVYYINGPGNGAFQCYDYFYIDGQALTPDVFGFYKDGNGYISAGSTQATDFRPGQWVPKTPRVIKTEINGRGGFGVNGFYLPMNDSSNFGADFHTTPNSIITLKGEDLPQPRNGAPTTTDAYVSQLRTDPYAANLVLAVPGILGAPGVAYTDFSANIKGSGTNKVVTANGDAGVAVTASYYGSALSFDGTGDYFTVPNTADLRMGSDDFTIEAWVNKNDTDNGGIFGLYDNGNDRRSYLLYSDGSGDLSAIVNNDGTSATNTILGTNASTNLGTNQWHHCALEREGSYLRLYLNGVVAGIATDLSGSLYENTDDTPVIGAWFNSGVVTADINGYIQDLRVYKGVAKYKGGFDVPKPYTPVGIGTWRSVPDTTANNFATLNPLALGRVNNHTFSAGNLTATISDDDQHMANIGINTGKWYWEINPSVISGSNNFFGVVGAGASTEQTLSYYYKSETVDGKIVRWVNGSVTNLQTGLAIADSNTIIGIVFNASDKEISFYKDGVQLGSTETNISSNGDYFPFGFNGNSTPSPSKVFNYNFGQNPTFSGVTTAGTYTDSNGKGLFKYEPPSGFLALCEDNLPTPAIADPGEHFKTVLYTGDDSGGNSRNNIRVGFKPDLVWLKNRTSSGDHGIWDSVRGATYKLISNTTDEESISNGVLSFDADGFSKRGFSINGSNYVAWCWKAGAGTTSTNTDGSIDSVVSVNQDAGFSIVSYTVSGTSAYTTGHGLNQAPEFIIWKSRNRDAGWSIYHKDIGNANVLRFTTAAASATGSWNSTTPTSSIVSHGGYYDGDKIIYYAWHSVEGFSKFGSYVGNGNADGPFVYCGFKPAFILMKRTDTTSDWTLHDNARDSINPANLVIYPNLSDPEYDYDRLDILSNGFKQRSTSSTTNASGGTYIFAAFAESPFQTANAK